MGGGGGGGFAGPRGRGRGEEKERKSVGGRELGGTTERRSSALKGQRQGREGAKMKRQKAIRMKQVHQVCHCVIMHDTCDSQFETWART